MNPLRHDDSCKMKCVDWCDLFYYQECVVSVSHASAALTVHRHVSPSAKHQIQFVCV